MAINDCALTIAGAMAANCVDPVLHQCQYLFRYRSNVLTLRDEMKKLELKKADVQQLVDAAINNGKSIKPNVIDWLRQVDDLKKEADAIFRHMENVKMNCLNVRLPNLKSHYLLGRDADKRKNAAQKLLSEGQFDEVGYTAPLEKMSFSESTLLLEEGLPTLMSTKKEVMRVLEQDKTNLIVICGMAGVGKTTLVNQIADQVKYGKLFYKVAMLTMSKNPSMRNAQNRLAEQLRVQIPAHIDGARFGQTIYNRLSGRVLVILDEIWKEVDFKSLGIPVSEKIKVIVTSQSPCVCRNMGAKIVGVNALPEEEACYLFKAVAGISDDSVLSDVAKQFAEECKGIPLALVVVARGLRTNCKTLKSWELALGQLQKYTFRELEGEKDLVYSIVEWSYDNLESVEAKSLLLLCSLFPEDYSIPVECLVRYGKGLELFNERDTLGDVRCRVDVLVNDLRSYHLLLDDSEREDHVKLHDVMRETCLKIASKGEHVFLVGNATEEERHQLPDSFGPYTAISLTLEGSIRLFPFGEECPRLKLLRLVFQSGKVNLSKDAFEGMEDLRVMELNNSHTEFSLSWPGQMLTSLRTLCLDYCVLDTGTSSMLGYMMQLEMLSFFKSRLQGDQFPVEIARLSNLKSLDLRVERSQQPLLHGILSSLKKLEELYMGSPHHLRLGRDKEEERGCLEEIASLSCLECLQIHVYDLNLLFQLLHQLPIQRLLRFHIVGADHKINRRDLTREYQFRNSFELIYYRYHKRRFVFKQALDPIVSSIVKRAENLTFEGVPCLRNLVSDLDEDGFVNLRRLKLDHEVHQCLIESTTNLVARQVFENLVFMELDHVNLEEICRGNLPPRCFSQLREMKLKYTNIKHLWKGPIEPPSLCSLRIVELRYCHRIVTLFSQSTLKCLVKLQKLVVHQCTNLESIVMREESVNEEVLELPLLETLVMQESGLLCFDSKRETARAFLNQVSLPRLEGLQIKTYRHRPKELVGDGMHSGYLENLKYLQITDSCIGCIAKADGNSKFFPNWSHWNYNNPQD
ncbi:disease resistance protein At4g27190-like [Coffea eugenioides]|uniref:disease resistance protein At4g27190-like n=1 Tax=Coffea eugenioides TaxID=49369 RepID=UPI000F610BCE|nr:disease resistance protein At4g27190-like [Coffea eugenioides]